MEIEELCDRHGYPIQLQEALRELADAVAEYLPELRSVVLSGSLPTGDFLWRSRGQGDDVELLSDIDGFAFAPLARADLPGLRSRLREIEACKSSPHFKIDLSVSNLAALNRIPRTFQMAETHQVGFVLAGDDVRQAFPESFDPRASRQAFLGNLWKPVGVWRDRGVDSGLAFSLAASRLLMDIATLAVSEEGICLAGHRARGMRLLQGTGGPLAGDPKLRDAVSVALEARRAAPGQVEQLEPLLAPALARTVALLDGSGLPPPCPDAALVRRLTAWLPPRTFRRRLGELRTLLQRPGRPDRDLRWLLARKEAIAGACLLGWIHWLSEGGEGIPPSGIGDLLSVFARRDTPTGRGSGFHDCATKMYRTAWREYSPSAS